MAAIKSKVLDVRPLLVQGQEPFALIRAEVDKLGVGQDLTVIAPFVPAPLIELLKGEGFASSLERRADGAWRVCFRRS
jgi:uncharacterized protein (DUF2249 family)